MAEKTVVPSVADLKRFIGVALGATDWVTITQKQIDAFAEATGDHQWIHVDPERAKRESPFETTIAHGYLTLALAPALLPQILHVEGCSAVLNYGVEKMRFPSPVPVGTRVRLSAQIVGVRETPAGAARVTISFKFEAEGSTRPACHGDAILIYRP